MPNILFLECSRLNKPTSKWYEQTFIPGIYLTTEAKHSVLECYNLFSGVKLSIRSFCFISDNGSKTNRNCVNQLLTPKSDRVNWAPDCISSCTIWVISKQCSLSQTEVITKQSKSAGKVVEHSSECYSIPSCYFRFFQQITCIILGSNFYISSARSHYCVIKIQQF